MPRPTKKLKFDPKMYVRIYELTRQGLKLQQVAEAIGVSLQTIKDWKNTLPGVAYAIERGRAARQSKPSASSTFLDYVYGRLPDHLQELYGQLENVDGKGAEARVEAILANQGKTVRQSLFVHALIASNFNKAEACRRVNISYECLTNWIRSDPDFVQMMDMVLDMKKDFCESALMGLVSQGDTSAVIFTNKTLNRDRGYDPKITVKHEGTVNHALDLASLGLPAEVMRTILDAIRAKRELAEKKDTLALPAGRVTPVPADEDY